MPKITRINLKLTTIDKIDINFNYQIFSGQILKDIHPVQINLV